MTEVIIRKNGDESADFDLPKGCPFCGGEISVRLTPSGANSCCIACRWMAKPLVAVNRDGLQVSYPAAAVA